jgi:type III secretion protein D
MELRILSGLHRGAVMELDEDAGAINVGASPGDEAAVLLADVGIATRHCRLIPGRSGWTLEPVQGKVVDAQGRELAGGSAVSRGQIYRLSEVWIGFFEPEDPWQEATTSPSAARTVRYPRIKVPLIATGVLVIAASTTWFVFAAQGNVDPKTSKVRTLPAVASSPVDGSPATTSSPVKLADDFARALGERELRDRLDLQLSPDQWEIRGSLDNDERQRFERFLVHFTETRRPSFPIKVSLVTPAELLPFTVVEAITGKSAGVVTSAGDRLQVGDALQGWKLVAVDTSKIVFQGRQRVEVPL